MSGGRLVVLDRQGREVKHYLLATGLATLGSHVKCDIRVMLDDVCPHHATIVVHAHQTVVRNVGDGETLVNGRAVSVAALRHGDLITVGDRSLRWEYAEANARRPLALEPALYTKGRKARRQRASVGGVATQRSPTLQLALELQHRASMPGSAGGKQVAIVQPQRRDTTEQNAAPPTPRSPQSSRRSAQHEELESERKSSPRNSPRSPALATKASMWIESRKSTPRKPPSKLFPAVDRDRDRGSVGSSKATPLRLAAMRRAALTKVLPPAQLDQTKQVAIMLMTGHTPKSKLSPSQRRTPSFVVKKRSPAANARNSNARNSNARNSNAGNSSARNSSARNSSARKSRPSAGDSVSILEISDATSLRSSPGNRTRSAFTPQRSPKLPTPKKSAMKDPTAKKSTRKTESIKFDLSNLENHSQNTDLTTNTSDDDMPLHYDTSSVHSPSPRRSIHSRSSRIIEKTLGTSFDESPTRSKRMTLTPQTNSPSRKSSRGSIMTQIALESDDESRRYSRRTTKTLTDQSCETTVASAYRTKTLSPRSPRNNLETYSIVDLVSIDSNETGRSTSIYNSAGSANSSAVAFGTPNNSSGRKTRSTIDSALVESSTPYVGKPRKSSARSRSIPNVSGQSLIKRNLSSSSGSRRSKSQVTPENSQIHISVNSTRVSRASKSRSRLSESDHLLMSDNSYVEDESPRTSRSNRSSKPSPQKRKTDQSSPNMKRRSSRKTGDVTPSDTTQNEGMSTPENRHSPEEVGTPVLSIKSLLDSSQSSLASQNSNKKTRSSMNMKRKTIGAIRSEPRTRRSGLKSKSLGFTARRGLLRLSKDSSDKEDDGSGDKMVTPKSAVKLVQEAVKNKHSTAKKPQSKRSIIDHLDESDIVKQLFNSPVKRKLSQSMTEFSRKQLFNDEEMAPIRRPTRNTIALTGRTTDDSVSENTDVFTPERFVSPIGTPSHSPDLSGIKRLFRKSTPENDLRNVRGVKALLKTPQTRKSIKNDLTNVSGVKKVFAKSPKNRLSDVRVKKALLASPKDDLRRVSGVKSLFRSQRKNKSPKNDLTDVRGVKNLFQKKSPANDLRRVSGVKRTLQRNSPRNDLTDVRGVKRMYGEEKRKDDLTDVRGVKRMYGEEKRKDDLTDVRGVKRMYGEEKRKDDLTDVRGVKRMYGEEKRKDDLNDVSGVEELFNDSTASRDTDLLFDRLLGRPPIRAKYSKSFVKIPPSKKSRRLARSLRASIDSITNNVEEWLEKELEKRLHKTAEKPNRELQKLATATVEGASPILESRPRRSAANISDSKLPIKKRSLIDRSNNKTNQESIVSKSSDKVQSLSGDRQSSLKMQSVSVNRQSGDKVQSVSVNRQSSNLQSGSVNRQSSDKVQSVSEVSRTRLPLKKLVVHSTPLKGRRVAARAPRHSPIPSALPAAAHDASIASDEQPKVLPEPPKSRRTTKAKVEIKPVTRSPKPTRASKTKDIASPKTRTTRNRKKNDTTQTNVRNNRLSLVIPKKTPVMSPVPARARRGKVQESAKETAAAKPKRQTKTVEKVVEKDIPKIPTPETVPKKTRGRKQVEEKVPTPKKTRGRKQPETTSPKSSLTKTRTRKTEVDKPKEATPKRTRAKVQKNVVIVSKPSPLLKPQKPEVVTRRSRKTTASENNDRVRDTKRRKVEPPKVETTKVDVEIHPKRGRRNQAVETKAETESNNSKTEKKTRTRNRHTQESTRSEPTTKTRTNEPVNRGRRNRAVETKAATDPNESKTEKKTRTRNLQTQESTQSEPTTKTRTNEPVNRGRRNRAVETKAATDPNESKTEKKTRTRNLQTQESTQSEPTSRRRRNEPENPTVILQVGTRKRKATTDIVVPNKVAKTRGEKAADLEETTQKETNTRQKRNAKQSETQVAPTTRGRKTAAAPPATTRARNTQANASPVKAEPQKSRSTRARAAVDVPVMPTGRSRRR